MTRGLIIGALVSAAALPAMARDDSVDSVLAHVREATGWSQLAGHTQGVQVTGKAVVAGVDGTYTLILDAAGRFVSRAEGTLSHATGFDGKRAWTEDLGGERH